MRISKTYGLALTFGLAFLAAAIAAAAAAPPEAEACVGCHGPGGVSPEPTTPIIAGVSRGFLVGAMLAYRYKSDLAQADEVVESDPELQDILVLDRPAISSEHIPPEYSIEVIKALATYYASQELARPEQTTDPGLAEEGRKLHDKYCEKCHEDGGASTLDDVGLLAGQWQPYLANTLASFVSGDRQMPKKMKQKMDALHKKYGDEGFEALTHFYASQ